MIASIGTSLGTFVHSLFAFMIILVPLVVFHELGHYFFAKFFGVRAEIFSVGFGPRIWGKQIGETEWRLSAIPMGGYVKLLGEEQGSEMPVADIKRSLHRQPPWKRFFIFLGGPLFNFLLAIFIFMAILAIGEPQLANVIGRVVDQSVAEKVGFRSGDRVISIDGKAIKKFEEIAMAFHENPDKQLHFSVLHPHEELPVHLEVKIGGQAGYSIYGENARVGDLEGLMPVARSTLLGISDSSSVLGMQGLQTGDKILKVNGVAIANWEDLEYFYSQLEPGAPFNLDLRTKNGVERSIPLTKPKAPVGYQSNANTVSQDLGQTFGLRSSELFVDKVVPKSPAEGAGIMSGDRLVKVAGVEVHSFFELKDAIQHSGEKENKVELQWERAGKIYSAIVVPTSTSSRDPVLNKVVYYTVGVAPLLELAEPETVVERILNPFKLVSMATSRMITFTERNIISLKKMVTGDVSVGNLGGPIMIGKVAGESLTRGLISFLTNMAVFSIGLGVLNILPVPVLDGGHLLLLGVEIIRRKPLSVKQLEFVQGLGLVFILALMGIAFHNDLARLFYS